MSSGHLRVKWEIGSHGPAHWMILLIVAIILGIMLIAPRDVTDGAASFIGFCLGQAIRRAGD